MLMFWHTLVSTIADVLPIITILLVFQLLVLRQPIPKVWQVIRGFFYVLLGLVLFLMGLEQAVFPLGDLMARQLTDPVFLFGSVANIPTTVNPWDYAWVYAFAFSIGIATTLAEPALIAVAMKAEQISGNAISALGLRLAVALGVAVGVSIGCYRIVSGGDLWLYILIAYTCVLLQTLRAPKTMIPLAYDSGGVTTSTVTVPLLAALGLGLASTIPGRDPVIDGFGLIAFACVFPIISVLSYAQISQWRNRSNGENNAL
ncbi:MAG: DUF1538 domain-containing protein [Mariprofundaceae bacterium]|nr:DUF1538 domain-containing protein [Mariprofundaceae bacterium]